MSNTTSYEEETTKREIHSEKPIHDRSTSSKRRGRSFNDDPQIPNGKKEQQRKGIMRRPAPHLMPKIIAQLLNEPKVALLHRVVKIAGFKLAWKVLEKTLKVEKQGGQTVNAYASGRPSQLLVKDEQTQLSVPRRRSTGGVYFTILREMIPKEMYREIYAIENEKKQKFKKAIRLQRKIQIEKTIGELGLDEMTLKGEEEVENGACDEEM